MSVNIALRLSSDVGNQLAFGADGGLYTPPVVPRGGPAGYTIDNSWATAAANTTYYFAFPGTSTVSPVAMNGTMALVWPFVFTRNCKISALGLNITTAGAGSTVYHSAFASDPTTGAPAGKISDVASTAGTATGVVSSAILDTTTVWQAHTLYWMTSWAYSTGSTYPGVTMRTAGFVAPIRLATAPTASTWFTSFGAVAYYDNARTWGTLTSAPASLSATPPTGSASPGSGFSNAPHVWLGLLNV